MSYATWLAVAAIAYAILVLTLMIREEIILPYLRRESREEHLTITPEEQADYPLANVVAPDWPNLLDYVRGDFSRECECNCPGCTSELERECEHRVVSLD